jgi:hypothetical protein
VVKGQINNPQYRPKSLPSAHTRTEGRALVFGSQLTSKAATLQGRFIRIRATCSLLMVTTTNSSTASACVTPRF